MEGTGLDIVYPVGPGPREWLRYSLRSTAEHLPHRTAWIVGTVPRWISPGAGRIWRDQDTVKWDAARQNFLSACRTEMVSDQFLLFNDDFFIRKPVGAVPVMHRGPLREQLDRWSSAGLRGGYVTGMREVLRILTTIGIREPLSYDLHLPMPVDKKLWLEADATATELRDPNVKARFSRTFYGNYCGLGGDQVDDVKVTAATAAPGPGPYLSTDPASWSGLAGRQIRRQFSTACRYEIGGRDHDAPPAGDHSRP
jgi:hypothetical protein